jgi:hypothetical protein
MLKFGKDHDKSAEAVLVRGSVRMPAEGGSLEGAGAGPDVTKVKEAL